MARTLLKTTVALDLHKEERELEWAGWLQLQPQKKVRRTPLISCINGREATRYGIMATLYTRSYGECAQQTAISSWILRDPSSKKAHGRSIRPSSSLASVDRQKVLSMTRTFSEFPTACLGPRVRRLVHF
ncbi:hypothetical protein AC1031_008908 [Aphanomyces cochlioides]|nr:hypothetical protein AC1031_008908 [Aphanomyces cochlioides]